MFSMFVNREAQLEASSLIISLLNETFQNILTMVNNQLNVALIRVIRCVTLRELLSN